MHRKAGSGGFLAKRKIFKENSGPRCGHIAGKKLHVLPMQPRCVPAGRHWLETRSSSAPPGAELENAAFCTAEVLTGNPDPKALRLYLTDPSWSAI